MKQIFKLFLLIGILISTLTITAQNTYRLSVGLSIPDNVSNKYLRRGISFAYGINIKLYKNLFLSTGLSATFNNKNNSYNFGFDDEPRFNNIDPRLKEIYSEMILIDIEDYNMYLFNTSIDLGIKYRFLNEKKFSPYLSVGLNGNYSFYKDQLFYFEFDNDGFYSSSSLGSGLEQQFNIGYSTAIGVNYKAIFLELNYRLLPNIKFGKFEDPSGFFILKVGVDLPFNNK